MERRMGSLLHRSGVALMLLVLTWGLTCPFVEAQSSGGSTDSVRTDSIPLDAALERLAATAEISLVYDADLVRGQQVECSVDEATPKATLRCLLAGRRLDFVQTSGGTYVVKPGVRRPARRGTVTGRVREAGTHDPLTRAHVRTADGTEGAVTDGEGRFRLSGLTAGRHTIVVTFVGYDTVEVDVTIPPEGRTRRTVTLSPRSISVDSVVVGGGSSIQSKSNPGLWSVTPDRLKEPSTVGTPSVAHAAATVLGVTTQAPYADLHIQGGASSDHEVHLDGVPVRNPAAAGRLLGAFSPLALDGLTARKAGFGGLRGDALSGLIDLQHDLQRNGHDYATLQADPVSVNGRADGTAALGDTRTQAMVAGRVGVWDLHEARSLSTLIDTWSVLDPVLTAAQLSADSALVGGDFGNRRSRPTSQFYDIHGAARFTFDSAHHLYVSAYRGRSVLGSDLVAVPQTGSSGPAIPDFGSGKGSRREVEVPTTDRYEWTNTVAQARYEARMSSRATATGQAFLSRYRSSSRFELGVLRDLARATPADPTSSVNGSRSTNAVTEGGVTGTIDLDWTERDRLTLRGSVTSLQTRTRVENAFVGRLHHADGTVRGTAAVRAQIGLGAYTTLEGSLRLTARPGRGGLYAEPRSALRYRRPDTRIGDLAIRVGGGLYRRYTTQFEVSRDGATAVVPSSQVWMPVPSELTPPRSYHLATTVTWGPLPDWSLSLEGYSKWQPHLLSVDYPALRQNRSSITRNPSSILSPSRGRAYGAGLRLSYDGDWGRGTVRYAFSRAQRTFPGRFGGDRTPTPWNEPHRVTLSTKIPLGNVLALDVEGTGIWGRRWGFRRAYYAYLTPEAAVGDGRVIPLDDPAEDVLSPFYRLDASLVARHDVGGVEVTGRIGLMNVLGRENVADWGLRPTRNGTQTRHARTLPGRRSILSLEIQY